MFLTTIANYTYGFAYKLGLDGALEMEATPPP
jgi:Cu2+-containing amine oxidase